MILKLTQVLQHPEQFPAEPDDLVEWDDAAYWDESNQTDGAFDNGEFVPSAISAPSLGTKPDVFAAPDYNQPLHVSPAVPSSLPVPEIESSVSP